MRSRRPYQLGPLMAFAKGCVKDFNKFLKGKDLGRREDPAKTGELPWKDPGEEEESEEEDTASGERKLRDEIQNARDGLAKLEKRMSERQSKGKGTEPKTARTGKAKAEEKADKGKQKERKAKKKKKKESEEPGKTNRFAHVIKLHRAELLTFFSTALNNTV